MMDIKGGITYFVNEKTKVKQMQTWELQGIRLFVYNGRRLMRLKEGLNKVLSCLKVVDFELTAQPRGFNAFVRLNCFS